ncbi:hypothetical protein SLEP1_g40292 [Rubroshorea leprosula]|uniref:Uncharacterized protein n=1 Tax=Rubroshorea leprosula TaxID=152421 RepID=A0AAV5L2Y9_9ROSI|nr:hypothetical protein SLEP1_g40292 [Rubroshorea leprosula]
MYIWKSIKDAVSAISTKADTDTVPKDNLRPNYNCVPILLSQTTLTRAIPLVKTLIVLLFGTGLSSAFSCCLSTSSTAISLASLGNSISM